MNPRSPDRTPDQERRIHEVERYLALGTLPEPDIADLMSLAALACNVPIALATIICDGQQWYASTYGIDGGELPQDAAFWGEAVLRGELMVVADTRADPRYASDPCVTGAPHLRFFSAVPLLAQEGIPIGAVCVCDRVPRALSEPQVEALCAVARQIMARAESRARTRDLNDSEARLIRVFGTCPVAMTIHRWADRVIIDANPAFTALTGWSRDEAVGLTIAELGLGEGENVVHQIALQSAELLAEELPIITKDGGTRTVLMGAGLVGLMGERHVITTFTDITDRKVAEERRRASEIRYQSLFDHAPDGILISDYEGVYLDANANLCRMLGYTHDEFVGKSGVDIVVPDEQVFIDSALNTIRSTPDYKHDWTLRRKDGSTLRAEVIAARMPDGNLLAMIRDITERARDAARFRRLVESNAQGVMFWNASGAVVGANDAFLRTLGFTRDDLTAGRIHLRDISPREYRHLDRRANRDLVTRGVCTPMEKEYIRKDGSRVPVLVGAATFEDNPKEGICFVLDLTERKKLEQQLLRTQRLESIGTLAGGIAHDLNNVLAPILLSVELLSDMVNDSDAHGILQTIEVSARHGADLVRQVLTFARGVQGRRVVMNPVAPLRDLFRVLHDTFPKTIDLRFTPDPEVWSITGDPTQIHQVFLNLCVNARDAMPSGGTLSVTMANVRLDETFAAMHLDARAGAYVLTTVIDTGVGMSRAVQERIYEPFFSTKDAGRGTGLGLPTSLAIVKSHGGFILLYSEQGRGTTFHVYLPANPAEVPEDQARRRPPRLPRGNGEVILVVDDEEALRTVVKDTLERFGYRVMLAVNGAEAVSVYTAHQTEIAVVITDMAMPVMGGPATIAALMAFDPTVKIIGSSGMTGGDGTRNAVGSGTIHFLPKPYSADALLGAIGRALDTGAAMPKNS
ncbi:MAG: PAS domain S-box protein [bacterium]